MKLILTFFVLALLSGINCTGAPSIGTATNIDTIGTTPIYNRTPTGPPPTRPTTTAATNYPLLSIKINYAVYDRSILAMIEIRAIVDSNYGNLLPYSAYDDGNREYSQAHSFLSGNDDYMPNSKNIFDSDYFRITSPTFSEQSLIAIQLFNQITPIQKYYMAGIIGPVGYFKSLSCINNATTYAIADVKGIIVGHINFECQ